MTIQNVCIRWRGSHRSIRRFWSPILKEWCILTVQYIFCFGSRFLNYLKLTILNDVAEYFIDAIIKQHARHAVRVLWWPVLLLFAFNKNPLYSILPQAFAYLHI